MRVMTIVTVVETPEFQRRARNLMSEEERLALVDFVARNPATGVSLGGGVRKFRFAREGSGKSGGYRVVHFFNPDDGKPIFLNLKEPPKQSGRRPIPSDQIPSQEQVVERPCCEECLRFVYAPRRAPEHGY